MVNFRVQYYNKQNEEFGVMFLDAENFSDVKELWNQKYKNKGDLVTVCKTEAYKKLLEQYGDVMNPLNG